MGRPSKTAQIDLSRPYELTLSLIERLSCPPEKERVFLRDMKVPGLAVQARPNGVKKYVFEGSLHNQTIRIVIGDVRSWELDNPRRTNPEESQSARDEARRYRLSLSAGIDPRNPMRRRGAKAPRKSRVTGLEAWEEYCTEGIKVGFKRGRWGERHYQDHLNFSAKPRVKKRGEGKTEPGLLFTLLSKPLKLIDQPAILRMLELENKARPARAGLAFRLLRGFLNWCSEHPEFKVVVDGRAHQASEVRRLVAKQIPKKDSLLREQLPNWFKCVNALENKTLSAYFQTLLLTGARPGEILELRWEDLNIKWRGLTIRDKIEGERVIPLTPYVQQIISSLPKKNSYVFAGDKVGRPIDARHRMHDKACKAAGVGKLTLHGLRRSFKNLTEWLDIPAGVVAQIMGHKPSATAEKHYTNRPLDLLRIHHERIESWILEQAGIVFEPSSGVILRTIQGGKK